MVTSADTENQNLRDDQLNDGETDQRYNIAYQSSGIKYDREAKFSFLIFFLGSINIRIDVIMRNQT